MLQFMGVLALFMLCSTLLFHVRSYTYLLVYPIPPLVPLIRSTSLFHVVPGWVFHVGVPRASCPFAPLMSPLSVLMVVWPPPPVPRSCSTCPPPDTTLPP